MQLPAWTSHWPLCSSGVGTRGKGAKRGSRRSSCSIRMANEEGAAADLPQVWSSSISTKKELVPALAEVGLSVGCGIVLKCDTPSVEQKRC